VLWVAGAAAIVAALYGVSLTIGVPYDDQDLTVVDFSRLEGSQKRAALREANGTRCTCGCNLSLAACIVTDTTCPLRTKNIERVRGMVASRAGV
jgi:hypothetical protein